MFLVSGGENFWKTLWIVVLFVVFIVPNLEYIRAIWGYGVGTIADGIESQGWEEKKPLDTVDAFLRKQERNAYFAQYDSMVDSYRELSYSAKKLSDIAFIRDSMEERGIPALFVSASSSVKKYMVDHKAEYVTEAKAYLERIEMILRNIARPWIAGWLIMVGLLALILGVRSKKAEDIDLGGMPSEMIQRSRFSVVRSYLVPSSILTLWYFWQFDPYFTVFGFYFVLPLTIIWFFIPYVSSKASV